MGGALDKGEIQKWDFATSKLYKLKNTKNSSCTNKLAKETHPISELLGNLLGGQAQASLFQGWRNVTPESRQRKGNIEDAQIRMRHLGLQREFMCPNQ